MLILKYDLIIYKIEKNFFLLLLLLDCCYYWREIKYNCSQFFLLLFLIICLIFFFGILIRKLERGFWIERQCITIVPWRVRLII